MNYVKKHEIDLNIKEREFKLLQHVKNLASDYIANGGNAFELAKDVQNLDGFIYTDDIQKFYLNHPIGILEYYLKRAKELKPIRGVESLTLVVVQDILKKWFGRNCRM